MKLQKQSIPLNHVDYLWLVMEELMPSMGQLITLRFNTRHEGEEIRGVIRKILSIYPRLRHLVRPGILSWRMKILDDDEGIDIMFNDMFMVKKGMPFDSPEYIAWRRDVLNRGFDLARELPLRAWYFPDQEIPVLVISLHHITCDGMGWSHMVDSIVRLLNGKEVSPLPVEDNRIYPSFLERPLYRLPGQLLRSLRVNREGVRRSKNIVPFAFPMKNNSPVFGPVDMHQQDLSFSLGEMKDAGRAYGCTVTVLFMAALALTMEEMDNSGTGNGALVHFLIDLRPFMGTEPPVFGNYIISGLVRAAGERLSDYRQLTDAVKKELDHNLDQVKKKNIIMPIILNGLIRIVGRGLSVRIGRMVETRGGLSFTWIYSNMGNLSRTNGHGDRAQLVSANATVSQQGIFLVTSCIGERINMTVSFPEAELSREGILNIIGIFEKHLAGMLMEAGKIMAESALAAQKDSQ